MARARRALVLVSLLAACGSGEAPPPSEVPPASSTDVPVAPATEIPTTPEAPTATSSIVSRPAAPATGCPASDAAAAALPGTVHANSITSAETLDLAGSPHRFPEGLSIDGATVTVEPCALVLVGTPQTIWINGGSTLTAVGDAEHPIRFDAIDPAATRGAWGGLYFNDGATPRSRLAYVTVEDAGADAGFAERGAIWATGDYEIAMQEVTVLRSGAHGVSLRGSTRFAAGSAALHVVDSGNADLGGALVAFADSNRVGSLPDLTQQNALAPEILLVGESPSVVTTQTWRNPGPGIRYHLRTELNVQGPNGPILTIAPGTTLAFDQGKAMFVGWAEDGGLLLDGQAEATRILLTSARSVQSPGDWPGLLFGEHVLAPATRVTWATVAFAGGDSGWGNPHGCGQTGADHAAIALREHPISAIEHVSVLSLGDSSAAIQRGFVSDAPPDYTSAAMGNDLASGDCAQSVVEAPSGCPDPVPACAR